MSIQAQTRTSVLENVRVGMPVYDSVGVFVGSVLYIQKESSASMALFGDEPTTRSNYAFMEDILELVFRGEDLFTRELTRRLRTFGYLCVVNGEDVLNSIRYFIPGDDIAYVATGTVFLSLPEPLLMSSEDE